MANTRLVGRAIALPVALAALLGACAPTDSSYRDQYLAVRYPKTWHHRPSTGGPGIQLAPKDWRAPGPPPVDVMVAPVEHGGTIQSLIDDGRQVFVSHAIGGVTIGTMRVGGKDVECMMLTQDWHGEKQPLRIAQIPGRTCLYAVIVRDGTPAPAADINRILDSLEMLQ